MPLQHVLTQFGNKIGLNPNNTEQRKVLLRFANEAAIELYQTSDMAGCLEEQYFKINADQTISLPDYVGQLRAMRTADTQIAIKLSQMRPRYNQFKWQDNWRNWRLKGIRPLQTSITNQSVLTLEVREVEDTPVVVHISGSTEWAANVSEAITMNAVSKDTVNAYKDIKSITKITFNAYNIAVKDVDGNQLTYIANDKLEAKFQIIDISQSPWVQANADPLSAWCEVLYKVALPWYSDDNQTFPAEGYDNVWVNKCLQLYYEETENIQMAVSYYQKAQQSLAAIHEDANRGTEDTVALVANPHDTINPRVGFGRDWAYAYRVSGR